MIALRDSTYINKVMMLHVQFNKKVQHLRNG